MTGLCCGQGYCANSLELGCDCLGHIQYFDGVLNDSKGAHPLCSAHRSSQTVRAGRRAAEARAISAAAQRDS